MSDHHLSKGLSLSSVTTLEFTPSLIPETRLLYQYSVPGSKHTSSKLHSLPRLFPISLDCLPGFWFLLFSFYAHRMTPSVRHRVIEVHYYYYYYIGYFNISVTQGRKMSQSLSGTWSGTSVLYSQDSAHSMHPHEGSAAAILFENYFICNSKQGYNQRL